MLTAVVAMVLAGAVLWGGCVSCQQAASKPATSCCQPSGRCQTPASSAPDHQHCASAAFPVQQYVVADSKVSVELQPAAAIVEAQVPAPVGEPLKLRLTSHPAYSAPDLYCLYSVFLI